jgi:hypothetical protein
MRHIVHLIVVVVWLIVVTPADAAITLATDGKTDYVIVVAKGAIPAEHTAARELAEHLKLVTGAEFPIRAQANGAKHILVGGKQPDDLGADGIILRTTGDTLVLAGGRPRGALYAVCTFLEDIAGVRWWTSTESHVPKKPTLTVPDLDVRYVPPLRYREAYYVDVMRGDGHAVFASRLRLNGQHQSIPPERGGHYSLLGWCHTFNSLVPANAHYAKHPEWFSLVNGKRVTDSAQLCLTNDAMREELTKTALAWIRKNPDAGMISISQNDCHGACECEKCAAVVAEEGSQSGPLIRFVNAVAADIAKEYPDFLVETLAYQYTRKPPKVTKPAKNVIVRLCSIEANFARPLSGGSNKSFGDDLRGWAAIAPNLFVWNYVTNFANYLIPQPNLMPIGDDLRFFTANRVIGVFQQGDALNPSGGDFLPLRAWLHAKLLWDPSRDQAALTKEFLDGYHGPAGRYLAKYLDLVAAGAAQKGAPIGCYNKDTTYVSDEALAQATKLFDEAAKAVAGDATLTTRLRRERLAIDHLRLLRWKLPDDAARDAYSAAAQAYVAAAKELGVQNVAEAQGFESYASALLMRGIKPAALPKPGDPVPAGALDVQESAFDLYRPGQFVNLVDDPKAANGKAARMTGEHAQWAVQVHADHHPDVLGKGPWHAYIVARVDAKRASGIAFHYGAFDISRHANVAGDQARLETAGDGAYHAYGMLINELRPGMYFWVSPPGNAAAVDAVYVDRVYLARASVDPAK